MILLRIKEWGIGRVGYRFEMGRAPFFIKFSWARKHKNVYLSLTHGRFHLPLWFWLGKTFLGSQSSFTQEGKPLGVWTLGNSLQFYVFVFPSRFFSYSAICFLSQFWFSCSALFSFTFFSSPQVVFPEHEFPESNLVFLIELTSNVFILGILQQSIWHRQCS